MYFKSRRKLKLISPKFQIKFIIFFSAFLVISFLTSAIIVNLFFLKLKSLAMTTGMDTDSVIYNFIDKQQFDLNTMMAITGSATLIIFIAAIIYFSHRIAGGIYRVVEDLKMIAGGKKELHKLKVRENDYFQELPEAINQTFESFEHDVKKDKAS